MPEKITYIVYFIVLVLVLVSSPAIISEPATSLKDPGFENLTRIDYPSMRTVKWRPRFLRPQDTLENIFGGEWIHVARFNRIDRRHAYPGVTIRVPENMKDAADYCPLPAIYEPALHEEKYILINRTEQWLGAYEFGRLKFSFPAATGKDSHLTPSGLFTVDARHLEHTSSLYKTADQEAQYPMDYAFRFHIGADNVSYWVHARDLPGKPASHGCIGLFDEEMQNRIYGIPEKPLLKDAKKLYDWAVGEDEYEDDQGELELLEDGPKVEVTGNNPRYR
jgi:hypothetical protein